MALTQDNIQLVSNTFLGMTLGSIEEAPFIMILEYKQGKQTVVDLSDDVQKSEARTFIEGFQGQSGHEMISSAPT